MANNISYMALDVGEKRIGVALASGDVRIAVPLTTILVDGNEYDEIRRLVGYHDVKILVVGYPRNQSGEPTAQSEAVEEFIEGLDDLSVQLVWRDESLTSVLAEDHLKKTRKTYDKSEIDAVAASIILADYLEEED